MNRYHYNLFEKEFGHLWKPYYQEPHRHYHTEHHIYRMVLAAEEQGLQLTLTQAWAIMFHDAVYIPGFPQNEELSVDIMQAALYNSNINGDLNVRTVRNCILSTINHIPLCTEAELVIDMDMVELAIRYEQNGIEIKKEFSPYYTREEYCKGRIKFLTGLLAKKQIFYTPEFKKYEEIARNNINEDLAILIP